MAAKKSVTKTCRPQSTPAGAAHARASKNPVLTPILPNPVLTETLANSRLLSKAEVVARVGLTFPTLWEMMRKNTFPRSRLVGSKVYWLSSEIDMWLMSLPLQRYKGEHEEAAG
jgi:predicted DNA-binding transcriptional regulator AlpA